MFNRKSPEDKLLDAYWLKICGYEEDAFFLLIKIATEVGTGDKKESSGVPCIEEKSKSSPCGFAYGEEDEGVHCE